MKCPKCNATINTEQINVKTDIAQCTSCGTLFKISENLGNDAYDSFDKTNVVAGTWYKTEHNDTIIGATTRSPVAIFMVPFMLVWSGGSLSGIYGTQIIKGEFNLFLSLFGIPFIIGSIVFWGVTLMSIWGKVEVTLNNKGGKVFTGIGTIGLVKNFLWKDITALKEKKANLRYPGSQGGSLVFEGQKRISFGIGLKQERLYYLLRAIKSAIIKNHWK
ncbi:hypothetical protein JBL43_16600 [Aureibaculum sp. A20]|uniref:DUF304 domain-containing protein n=1 Tax=Aureibaculum flavum TaxID=2795986 RepID=A0ABS0WV51_9FLAO|nr:hypothetical protein [Aureibaculum flavum]MBJ2175876.1 hypothetical protein [Aureibaculum flavum]